MQTLSAILCFNAKTAAKAALENMQNPMARSDSAWCPGGRERISAELPFKTSFTPSNQPPADFLAILKLLLHK